MNHEKVSYNLKNCRKYFELELYNKLLFLFSGQTFATKYR